MTTFDELLRRWPWRPIPGCPGRYRLARLATVPSVDELLGAASGARPRRYEGARDPVLLVRLEGGGLISYLHADGHIVHTLGDSEGFARKLVALGRET
ncbi:MAG: hypothetical protein IT371_26775 [Deltaproteobacteria bacterium]|nr:hypothetical protein [Deltaproteobacteria bacterium]